jgi:hypothetical protein
MFGATIDIYHDEISAAISEGNHSRLCEIARAFCERCHYYKPWAITNVRSRLCPIDGLQVYVDIEIGGDEKRPAVVCVGYLHGKRRLTVNGESISCGSSADAVHALEVPCAFFDGIYYAVEGLVRMAQGELREQVAKWDDEAKSHRAAADREWFSYESASKALRTTKAALADAEERLAKAVEGRRLVGRKTTWTLCPVDFSSRIVDAQSMMALCYPDFVRLADAKSMLSGKSGIYFGWRVTDGKCVYVGKSENLGNRLHPRREELADCKVTYIEMPPEEIHTWELFFIWLHRPERNREVRESNASRQKRLLSDDSASKEAAHAIT